jgi:ADP-ribose pyrophosphatase YjhB (NUDIX family)
MADPKLIVGVNLAIILDGIFMLTKQRDFTLCCLIGGEVEAGKPPTQAAMREARES